MAADAAATYAELAAALAYERALSHLGAAFAARGVEPVLVKGQALVDLGYGPCAVRLASDVDLLVDRGDEARALADVLVSLGYRERLVRGRRFSQPYLGERLFWPPDEAGVPVELHTSLDKQVRRPIDYAAIRARSRPSGRAGFRYPCPEDLFLLVVLHAATAHAIDVERTVHDLHGLALRATLDWPALGARASRWRLRVALECWLALVRERSGFVAPLPCRTPPLHARGPSWLPEGPAYFARQLAWHDSVYPVLRDVVRYSGLRLLDRLAG
jgi:hypothetical protein